MQLFCAAVLVIINIYKLCSLFSASVGLYTFGDRLYEVEVGARTVTGTRA